MIEFLREKVEKAEERVEKRKKTIERHKKQLEKKINSGASEYELRWKREDIEGATEKLKEAQETLKNWKTKLNVEIEKERFLEGNAPQVIKDFLEQWKNKAYEWHIRRYNNYQVFSKNLDEEAKKAKEEIGVREGWMPNDAQREELEKRGLDYRSIQEKKRNYAGQTILYMCGIRDEAKRNAWLDQDLEKEKKAKMLDLITRINDKAGEITDATLLSIGDEGNLNGYIIGKKGRVKVETIGAGGWNIQCFHFRTLVHKVG